MNRSIALSAVVIATACVNTEPPPSVRARVVADRLELDVRVDPGAGVEIAGRPPTTVTAERKARLPIAGFPVGRNKVDVVVTEAHRTSTVAVEFDKPGGADAPYVRLVDCRYITAAPTVALTSPVGDVTRCSIDGGAIDLELEGSQGATLTIAGTDAAVGPDGRSRARVALDAGLLDAPVGSVTGGEAPRASFPLALRRGNDAIDAVVDVTYGDAGARRARQLYLGVGKGVALARGAAEPRSLVYVPARDTQDLVHLGRTSAVGAVGLVAIATDREARTGGTCAYDGTTATRNLVDIDVAVYRAATGEEVARRAFTTGHEECPVLVMTVGGKADPIDARPTDTIVTRWLASFVRGEDASGS